MYRTDSICRRLNFFKKHQTVEQQVYRQWYMLYQNNAHWHGEAASSAAAAMAVEEDFSVAAASASALLATGS
jgi:hypothetical protein